MTVIVLDQFKGLAPRVDPHVLPDGFGQVAENTKLIRGILQPWRDALSVQQTDTGINTIFRYPVGSAVNWLCWSADVSVVKNTIPGDTKATVIWSDSADGMPKHSRNDKLVFTSNFVKDTTDYFRLGVPAPTVAPNVTVSGVPPVSSDIKAYAYCWEHNGNLGGLSDVMYVALGEGQNALLRGLDTNVPIATSNWPNGKATDFRKFIFQVDIANAKYALVAKVTNDTTEYEDTGKAIRNYGPGAFSSARIDPPASASVILNDDCSSTAGWTVGTNWTHGTTTFTHAPGAAGDLTRAVSGLTIGQTYVIYLTTFNQSAGTFTVKLDTTAILTGVSANQTHVVRFTATATSHNIVISADSLSDVVVDTLQVNGTEVEVVGTGEADVNTDERRYAYCFVYQAADGSLKRTALSGEATLTGVEDGAPVLITGMASSSGLSVGATVKKKLFRKDKDTNGTWRVVGTMPESQTTWEDSKRKSALGGPISNWALVASGTPTTPTVALKDTSDTSLSLESRYYVYTYVTNWGEESAPSPVSALTEVAPWQDVTLVTPTTAPAGYGNVAFKRFYRTDSQGVFRVLFETDQPIATGSVADTIVEAELGDAIVTTEWDIPPGNATSPLKGLCMLPNGILCGGWGNQVGFSEPGAPYAWPVANQFSLDYEFVGAAVTANGVIIGTKGTPYLCQGSDPASMVPVRIEQRQACLSATSMVDMGDYTIYASPDGLVAVSGMDAQVITEDVITRDQWQGYVLNAEGVIATLKAYLYERRYFLFYANADIPSSGLLTPLTPPKVAAGTTPQGITISSDGSHVYVANRSNNNVYQYSRDPTTGLLSALTPATVAAGSSAAGIILSPDGNHAYVSNSGTNSVSQYSRNPTTGQLTALSPATVATNSFPYDISISPDGKNVYVANTSIYGLSQYSRNPTTGLLSALSPSIVTSEYTPTSIIVSPDGNHVYVTNDISNLISQYSRNPTTGLLSALSPATIATAAGPVRITISKDGAYVYVANAGASVISQYSRNPTTGQLTPLSPATVSSGNAGRGIAISPDGLHLYQCNVTDDTISQYSRSPTTGLLTALTPATVAAGDAANGIVLSPDGANAYVTLSGENSTAQFGRPITVIGTKGGLLFDPATKDLVTITLSPTAGFNDLETDSLYLQFTETEQGFIKKWDAGSPLTYTWRSGRKLFDFGVNFAAARVDAASYPVTFKLYADGVLRHTQTVANNRAFRLPAGYRAFDVEVEISGTSDVRHVVLATDIKELLR